MPQPLSRPFRPSVFLQHPCPDRNNVHSDLIRSARFALLQAFPLRMPELLQYVSNSTPATRIHHTAKMQLSKAKSRGGQFVKHPNIHLAKAASLSLQSLDSALPADKKRPLQGERCKLPREPNTP